MNEVIWSGGHEHWVEKGDVRLFLWERKANPEVPFAGTVFFVHGSSMASQPTFDLHVPGRANSSVMQWFNAQGFDTWTMDNEGYGRSSKHRQINCDINNGAEDLAVGTQYVLQRNGGAPVMMYGISSGALKAGLFAQRHPERVARIALDAFVWTGEGSPSVVWQSRDMATQMNPGILIDGYVYGINGNESVDGTGLSAMELTTGKVAWTDPSIGHGAIVSANGQLIVVTEQGVLQIGTASPKAWKATVTEKVTEGRVWSGPKLNAGSPGPELKRFPAGSR